MRKWGVIKDNIDVSSTSNRYIQRFLAVDGSLYELRCLGYSVALILHKSESSRRGVADDSTRRRVADDSVALRNLVYLSSSYTWPYEAFLLLGNTDEDYMHVLLVPGIDNDCAPEVKEIPLTWAEARAILDRNWKDTWRLDESPQD